MGRKRRKREHVPKKTTQAISLKRFGITYISLMGFFFVLIAFQPIRNIVDLNRFYTKGVVTITAGIMKLLGIACTCHGAVITLPGMSMDVRFGCNGLEAVMIYAVAVIAFPASWEKRLIGIVGGFVLIQIVNVIRIVALAYSGIHFRKLFEYIHIYVAQGMMIAVALGIYLLWIGYAKADTPQS
jgi:exosortase H (IPTLxxWG-CTERM-specific)